MCFSLEHPLLEKQLLLDQLIIDNFVQQEIKHSQVYRCADSFSTLKSQLKQIL